ncbi:MAG: S8 family serine peptidase [Bacteroidales bacterium]|nr:S8 family serine peptidase [Bacteroidales bacterium]
MIVALIMLQCSLFAQDAFIYGMQGDKQYMYEDSSLIVIGFKSLEYTSDSIEIATIIETIDANVQYEMMTPRMMKLQTDIKFDSIVNILSVHNNELIVSKVYYPVSDNHIHWCNNRIVVMLQSMELLQSLLGQLSIEYEEISIFNKDTYVITLSGIEDMSIQVSNMLYETGQVTSAQPDFYFIAELNNAYYSDQWGLHNTGQYGQAYSGIDIKAPEAWDITRGNRIKVAVIDCGVDLTHPDLYNNLSQGYDATGEIANGGCYFDNLNGHGTCCAGIIAAENNTIGTVGVASSSTIIPIRIGRIVNDFVLGQRYVFNRYTNSRCNSQGMG